MSSKRTLRGLFTLIAALLVVQALAIVPAWAQNYTDIYVLGRPGSTFSPYPPKDLGELKDLFDRYEADLRVVLEKGSWGGNADDFFTAVRTAKEGDGTVTRRTIQPGESFQWMAYRKGGKPDVIRNPRWSAKKPFDAWQIKVPSGGTESIFVVPQSCMNLALDSERKMVVKGPSCNLSATFDPATDTLTVTARSDGDIKITNVGIPGGKASVSDLKSDGAGKWTFKPTADGMYNFSAEATKGKQTTTCEASVQVGRRKASCDIDVSVDPETDIISVDASGSQGDFTMTGLTLPDGTTGDLADMQSVGDQKWTYDPSATLKRKPADYTYTFSGTANLFGTDSTCDSAAIIRREGLDHQWIARGYFVKTWPGSDTFHVENPVGADPPIFTQFWVDGGNGFGGEVEYLFRPNIGVWAGLTFANMKTSLMFDQGDIWLTSTDRVDTRELMLGVNYHFLPSGRFDPFLGVYADWVNYSSSTFFFEEVDREYRIEYDNELTYGVNLGIDFPIKEGSPWVITGALRWTGTDLEGNNNIYALPVDPINGIIGLGYRW